MCCPAVTGYVEQTQTIINSAQSVATGANEIGIGNDVIVQEGATANTTENTISWPGWVLADGDIATTMLVVYTKTDTGDPAFDWEGMVCINTFDNTVKMYADGGWRTMASGW